MRKLSLFAALVVAMTAVSCVKDFNEGTPISNDGAVVFSASFDAAATKAVLKPGAEESKVEWEAGDQVGVLVGVGNYLYTAASAGTTTTLNTEATDVPTEGTYYAVYPYNASATLAEGVIGTVLPAEQPAVLGSFATHLAVAKANGNLFSFKNVCGLVKVTVSTEQMTKLVFKGNNNEVVAGGINVTVSNAPTWTAAEGETEITLLPSEGETLAVGEYFFAVLPQKFEGGFTVTGYKGEEAWDVRKVESPITIERCSISTSNSFGVEGSGTEADPYILDCAQDFVDMRELAVAGGETWFKMKKDIDMAGITDFVPINYDNSHTRKLHFDGGNFTISNFKCDNSTYGGNYPSLFGVLYGSCKNLKVDGAVIKGSGPAGVIAGYAGTTGKEALVENVTITNATHTNTSNRAGGVCGVAKEATFKNVSFQGSVTTTITTSEAKSGGFVGETETSATFENCSTDVTVKGAHSDLGGFAGKTNGEATFTGCKVKVALESSAGRANRAGGFIGWSSATATTITNCHVLSGSTVKETSARTESEDSYIGGFIGFGDRASAVVKIKGCSSKADVTVGNLAPRVSAFIGNLGYASTVTIEDSYAEGTVTSAKNYVGGLVGIVYPCCNLTIKGCHFNGTLSGASAVGGLIGGYDYGSDKSGKLVITKSYSTGSMKGSNHNIGGIVGLTTGETVIENCWSSANQSSSGQYGGGIVGGSQVNLTVRNCFTTGVNEVSRGSGGIAGQVKGTSVVIEGCVAWGTIKSNRSVGQYSCGAIVGNTQIDGTFKTSYRKADMSFTDVAMTLVDHDDCTGSRPPLPTYEGTTADKNQYAYHGKAAAADATISSVATTLGWSTDIWDLSGDVPALK